MSKPWCNHFLLYKKNIIFPIMATVLLTAMLIIYLNHVQPSTTENNKIPTNNNALTAITNNHIEQLLATMDLDCKLEQLLIVSPKTPIYADVNNYQSSIENLDKHCFGGIIVHGNTFFSEKMAKLEIADWQKNARYPLFISVDEEGGIVSRLSNRQHHLGIDSLPEMQSFGKSKAFSQLKNATFNLGQQLRGLGINLNYAPVADVLTNPDNTAIAGRSFGSDPNLVASMTAIVVTSLQSQKVASTLKHFPGQGAANNDPHFSTTIIDIDEQTYRNRERLPFDAGIKAGASVVMLAHAIYPHLDTKKQLAMFSPYIINTLLREELNFQGIVITDALNMQAVQTTEPSLVVPLAIKAGVDMLIQPSSVELAISSLKTAINNGEISMQQIDQSLRRIWQVKFNLDLLSKQN